MFRFVCKQFIHMLSIIVILLLMLSVSAQVDAQQGEAESEMSLPGKIAYVGTDFNVYAFDGKNNTTAQISEDAMISATRILYYRWPTWSTDGRLAYFGIEESLSDGYTTTAHVSLDGMMPGQMIYEGEDEVFNYASWSPQNCTATEDCRELSILLNSTVGGGLFVSLVQDEVQDNPKTIIGRGGPFYYSWSMDGQQMLWQRNNRRLDIFDVQTGEVLQQLAQRPGFFQAPHWSPVDNRLLIGELNPERATTNLVIVSEDETLTIAEDLAGVVYFAWSPDGEYVAYVNRQGPLVIVNSTTGKVITSSVVSGVSSFFWSPDSQKIVYITLATPQGAFSASSGILASLQGQPMDEGLVWSVLDVNTDDVQRYGPFVPTGDMVYMFTYFDQFAQSHRIWSPDSRYIVYSEIVNESPVVSVIDTQLDDTVPIAIADGYLGIWSMD